jgi:hypothetical protein
MTNETSRRPLNGEKTHPLSKHALQELSNLIACPLPTSTVNPGVVDRLTREGLAEVVDLRSPFKTHQGKRIPHLQITALGRAVVEAGNAG